MGEQAKLLEVPVRPANEAVVEPQAAIDPKWRTGESRAQTMLANICVEEPIPADHKARAIWELAGRLDRDGFAVSVKTAAACAGRPAWEPRLLVSVWVYADSEGIGSAREIELA
ncbi:MAG: hypothetical protein ACRD4O_03795 [Bryobacteraceae bacterium]